jgi:DNA-binding NtrC family response regulator
MPPARVALVDDDALFVDYMAAFLRSRGYEPVIYRSGAALLDDLRATHPPDIVLLDVLMPGMTGLEALKGIHVILPDLPVVMVSGQQVPATIIEAVRLGALDYVLKPSDADGIEEAALEAAIHRALERVTLRNEVARLSAAQPEEPDGAQPFWGSGPAMRQVMKMVERVADSEVSVLLAGESGVGKEVIAREIHRRSPRQAQPFVKVNCAALPAELLESELFGHERGAFTGAQVARVGKFAYANEGTLMLDEIAEMPPALQAKLLHVLQDSAFTRLGSNQTVEVDVRVIAASNRELAPMIQAGQFREDLYYRLQVIEIRVPPLRQRRDEILALAEFFLRRYAARYGRQVMTPSADLREALLSYQWPGNVRELENMMKRYVILQDEALLLPRLRSEALRRTDSPDAAGAEAAEEGAPDVEPPPTGTRGRAGSMVGRLPDLARTAALAAEREAIERALVRFHWNRRQAAQRLGVSYKTLLNKMKQCGITAPSVSDSAES